MNPRSGIVGICKTVDPDSADRFVGLRGRSGRPELVFPYGYGVGADDRVLQADARELVRVLGKVDHANRDAGLEGGRGTEREVSISLQAHLRLIEQYLRTGRLISERYSFRSSGSDGTVDWNRTISSKRPAVSNGNVVYFELVTRQNKTKTDSLVTLAHEFCLHRSFGMLGWLFTDFRPPAPQMTRVSGDVLNAVIRRLRNTFNDTEAIILRSMVSILKDEIAGERLSDVKFGTPIFQNCWESMVERVFGDESVKREDFFPRTTWQLPSGRSQPNPLYPDTIMSAGGKIFILDAKYYRYGVTGNPKHLPGSSDIGKQIIYGEHAVRHLEESGYTGPTYNAFIIPARFSDPDTQWCKVVGLGTGSWIAKPQVHQHVVAVTVDTAHLLRHQSGGWNILQEQLGDCISAAVQGDETPPVSDVAWMTAGGQGYYADSRTGLSANEGTAAPEGGT